MVRRRWWRVGERAPCLVWSQGRVPQFACSFICTVHFSNTVALTIRRLLQSRSEFSLVAPQASMIENAAMRGSCQPVTLGSIGCAGPVKKRALRGTGTLDLLVAGGTVPWNANTSTALVSLLTRPPLGWTSGLLLDCPEAHAVPLLYLGPHCTLGHTRIFR